MSLRIKFISHDKNTFTRFGVLFKQTQEENSEDLSGVELKYYNTIATAIADSSNTNIDCFVFYVTKGDDGLDDVRRVRLHKDFLFAPVIVISNQEHKVSLPEYIRHGVQDFYVEKNMTSEALAKTLKTVLGKIKIWGNIKNQKKKKEDHLAVVSHDIKGPLTIIKSYMEILLSDPVYELNELAREKIKRTQHNANLALDLVVDILDEFRSKKNLRLSFEKLSCNEIINDVIKNLKHLATEKGINFVIKQDSNYDLFADKKSMYQLLTNLLDNSLKYSPENSTVRISVRLYKPNDSSKGSINIVISDEGPGLDPSKLESIFSPFKQASDDNFIKGHGLGLSICRRICQYHMGKIWASNRALGGTSFNILLPVFENPANQLSKNSLDSTFNFEENSYQIAEPKHILVVDDLKDIRDITKKRLLEWGFSVSTAKNGMDALAVVQESKPDLILLDLNMPILTGDQFIEEMRAKGIKVPTFLFSILKSEAIFTSSLRRANGFIQKPLQLEEFITKTSVYLSWQYENKIKQSLNKKEVSGGSKALGNKKSKSNILIVDDCKDNHDILKYYFYKNNYDFDSAFSGKECLTMLESDKFDLVLLDLNMPLMDGFETAQKIKKIKPSMPVVAFSADDIVYKEFNGTEELFVGFLSKPVSPDDLKNIVSTHTV